MAVTSAETRPTQFSSLVDQLLITPLAFEMLETQLRLTIAREMSEF
jgi:hypothetical protein